MLGALIGAGASLIGGMMGQKSQEKTAAQNIALQKEFAQSGIQWKVEDAKKAGVHPLYALGANTQSFAPVSIGTPLADSIGKAGQFLGRAADASSSPTTRMQVLGEQASKLQLDNMALQNQLLASQIARINQAGRSPPMPEANARYIIEGQGQTALPGNNIAVPDDKEAGNLKIKPYALEQSQPGGIYDPSSIPGIHFDKTPSRGYSPVYSKEIKDRLEDDTIGMLMWNYRNRILPNLNGGDAPVHLGPTWGNMTWYWDRFDQSYRMLPPLSWKDRASGRYVRAR